MSGELVVPLQVPLRLRFKVDGIFPNEPMAAYRVVALVYKDIYLGAHGSGQEPTAVVTSDGKLRALSVRNDALLDEWPEWLRR